MVSDKLKEIFINFTALERAKFSLTTTSSKSWHFILTNYCLNMPTVDWRLQGAGYLAPISTEWIILVFEQCGTCTDLFHHYKKNGTELNPWHQYQQSAKKRTRKTSTMCGRNVNNRSGLTAKTIKSSNLVQEKRSQFLPKTWSARSKSGNAA